MWFAYVDESYNDDQHWVVALLVEDKNVNEASRALRAIVEIAEDYGVPSSAELHGHDVFHGKGAFEALKSSPRLRVMLYDAVLTRLVEADCSIIFRGVSKPGLVRRYNSPEHPHRVVMTHLIERVDSFCKAKGELGLLVADEHQETQSTLLRDLVSYQDYGTWGYLAKKIERAQQWGLRVGADATSRVTDRRLRQAPGSVIAGGRFPTASIS
jgi:Protein of unknown function (DUF3800)